MFGALKKKLTEWKDKLVNKEIDIVSTQETKKSINKKEKKHKKLEKSEELVKEIKELEKAPETSDLTVADIIDKDVEETVETDKETTSPSLSANKDISSPTSEIEDILKTQEESKQEKKSFFSRVKESIGTVEITSKEIQDAIDDLELVMLENNVALEVIDKLQSDVRHHLLGKKIAKKDLSEIIQATLRQSINSLLLEPFDIIEKIKEGKSPFVIIFFGINGAGKTTTIAKLTHYLQKNKLKCVLAAGDTFRAASIEQLEKHGEKLNTPVIKQKYGSDPAAVGFDAIQYAKAHNIDVVLIDTAGRMHTKANLMKEIEKIIRVTKPDLKIFVSESITGNDAIDQAREFNESAGIDGSILTKADIDEKGGTLLSIGYITKKPIIMLGVGQEYEDLEKFDKDKILEKIGLN